MSTLDGKQLSYAAITAPIFVEGVGNLGPSLSTTATGSSVMKMTIQEPWVLLECKRRQGGGSVSVPVPLTSFTHTVLAPTRGGPSATNSKAESAN